MISLPETETPVTAVERRVTIVAEHEVLARRNHQLTILYVVLQHRLPGRVDTRRTWEIGEVVTIVVGVLGLVRCERLLNGGPVAKELLVSNPQPVAGNAGDPLYEDLLAIERIPKDHDVVPPRQRAEARADSLHEDAVAVQYRVLHAAGRDREGLQTQPRQDFGGNHDEPWP